MSAALRKMTLALPLLALLGACKPQPPKPADTPPAPQVAALHQAMDRAKQAQAAVERMRGAHERGATAT